MIELKGIQKSYGGLRVLRSVDLTVNQGDVIAIIGPSGSGKSTLLKSINYLVKPESGVLKFKGNKYDLQKISKKSVHHLRKHIGMVFQNFGLFSHLTVLENLTYVLIHVHGFSEKTAVNEAKNTLASVGLSDKLHSFPSQLSGGQQQRVGIARAIVSNPELILFDEPTSALDPELVGDVQKVIKQLAGSGQTMIVVTHEISFAKEVADRILFMEDGQIATEIHPDDLYSEAAPKRLKQFIGGFSYVI